MTLKIILTILIVLLGGYMLVDGGRALLTGDYITPQSGPYAGQLGPWAGLVQRVGIEPRSTLMKAAFVLLGAAWLVTLGFYWAGAAWAMRAFVVLAWLSIWYLPFGTIIAFAVMAVLIAWHGRVVNPGTEVKA